MIALSGGTRQRCTRRAAGGDGHPLLSTPAGDSAALRVPQPACGAPLRHEAHPPPHSPGRAGRQLPGHADHGEAATTSCALNGSRHAVTRALTWGWGAEV